MNGNPLLNERLQLWGSLLALAYVLAIQIPLLSPFRVGLHDEMQLVDAAYALSSGANSVPGGPFWGQIRPETERVWTIMTPHLYLLAGTMKVFGLSPSTTGLMHIVSRLLAIALFFRLCTRLRLSTPPTGLNPPLTGPNPPPPLLYLT